MTSQPQPDSRLPRYQRLRDELAARIANQTWRPGEAIPTEAELSAHYGFAIGTVRKAIDMLVAEGLVEREQGRGTFVRRSRFENSMLRFLRHRKAQDGDLVPESIILSLEAAGLEELPSTRLRLPKDSPAIHMVRLRLIGGTRALVEDIWLPRPPFAKLLSMAKETFPPLLYPLYEQLCGQIVASAEETLTVGILNEADAGHLEQSPGTPAVEIERLAFDPSHRPLEWRRSRAAGNNFSYKIEIR